MSALFPLGPILGTYEEHELVKDPHLEETYVENITIFLSKTLFIQLL